MNDVKKADGPISLAPETRHIPAAVMQRVAETVAQCPASSTLIDEMSTEDFLADETGEITVGKLKTKEV